MGIPRKVDFSPFNFNDLSLVSLFHFFYTEVNAGVNDRRNRYDKRGKNRGVYSDAPKRKRYDADGAWGAAKTFLPGDFQMGTWGFT